jgi:hypothetical protein
MTRNLLTLTFIASLLATGVTRIQAQNQEKQAEKAAPAPSAENPFDSFQQFSATLNGGIGRDTNRRIQRSGKLMRMEFDDHYRITDLEKRVSWLVYPKRCSKFPMLDPAVFPFSRKFRVESSTIEGKETVDGHPCKIEDAVLVAEGAVPTTFKMKLYEAEDLKGFPIRIDSENLSSRNKVTFNYSNVSLEPPDPKLFEHPTKCDKPMTILTQPESKPKPAKPAVKAPSKPAPRPE